MQDIIAVWSKFQVTNRKMKKYEKEYLLKKEQEAQLEDPVERLQVYCTGFNFLQLGLTSLSCNDVRVCVIRFLHV